MGYLHRWLVLDRLYHQGGYRNDRRHGSIGMLLHLNKVSSLGPDTYRRDGRHLCRKFEKLYFLLRDEIVLQNLLQSSLGHLLPPNSESYFYWTDLVASHPV